MSTPKKRVNPQGRTGRPPEPVPQDVAAKLLEHIANGGTLTEFCKRSGMDVSTVTLWKQKDEVFAQDFARAREAQAHAEVEQARDITDKATPEDVQVAKLRADVRFKRAACFCPRVYGQKAQIEHSGTVSLEQLVLGSVEKQKEEP